MLARNDAVFLCGALLLGICYVQRSVFRPILAGLAATVLVLPWLLTVFIHTGTIVPQSGLATRVGVNASAFGWDRGIRFLEVIGSYALEAFVIGVRRPSLLILLGLPMAVLLTLWLWRQWSGSEGADYRYFLLAASIGIAIYYVLISGAAYAYVRYLMPFKLLLMVALVRWLIGHWEPKKAGIFHLVVLLLVSFGLVKTTYRTYIWWGKLAPHMSASLGFLEESIESLQGKRIGMFESGRAGYRFPGQVLNLDGKSNLSALRSILENDFLNYLERDEVQVLLFREYHRDWLDQNYPDWWQSFENREAPPGVQVWERRAN